MNAEASWIKSARAGDVRAFGRLIEHYQKPVFSLSFRMLGNAGDAEDAAQESFLKAFRALASYDPRRSFSTWLLSITAHHCIDRLRRKRLQEVSLDGLPAWRGLASDGIDPEHAAIRSDHADRIGGLLGVLGDQDRMVIVLRYWHDLGYAEIAEIMDNSVSSVKSRLHRARRQIAAALPNELGLPPGGAPGSKDEATEASPETRGIMACNALMPAS